MQFCSSLELRNFYAIRELDLEFGPGPIGIIGRNGAGKSTLLTSMYWLLTGDLSRFPRTKEKVINHFRRDKEPAYGKGTFFIGGKRVTIYRSLVSTKAELEVEGGERVEGSTLVNARIGQLLGVPKSALANFMFIDQKGLLSALQDSGRKRLRDLSDTCGVYGLEAKHKGITAAKAAFELEAAVDESSAVELEKQLAQTQQEYNKANALLELAAEARTLSTEEKAARLLLAQDQDRKRLEEGFSSASAQLQSVELEIRAAALERDSEAEVVTSLKRDQVPLKHVKHAKREARLQVKLYHAYDLASGRLLDIRGKLTALVAENSADLNNNPTDLQLEEADDYIRELKEEAAPLQALLRSSSATCRCPTCLRSVDPETLAVTKKRLSACLPKIAAAETQRKTLLTARAKYEQVKEEIHDLESCVAAAEAELKEIERRLTKNKLSKQDAKNLIKIHSLTISKEMQRRKTLAAAELRQAHSAGKYDEMLRTRNRVILPQLKTLSRQLTAAPAALSEARIVELEEKIKEGKVREDSYNQAKGYCSAIREQLRYLKIELDQARAKAVRAKEVRKLTGPLTLAAEALHWQNLPKKIVARQLQPIAKRAAQDLEAFGSPFQIRVLDDMTIEAAFPGEPWLPADALSIGQQGVLCLPLAVAAASMHYGSVGVLALDEPGADFDDQNTAYFSSYISALTESNKSLQIFVVTHAKAMSGAFKQVIELMPQR